MGVLVLLGAINGVFDGLSEGYMDGNDVVSTIDGNLVGLSEQFGNDERDWLGCSVRWSILWYGVGF